MYLLLYLVNCFFSLVATRNPFLFRFALQAKACNFKFFFIPLLLLLSVDFTSYSSESLRLVLILEIRETVIHLFCWRNDTDAEFYFADSMFVRSLEKGSECFKFYKPLSCITNVWNASERSSSSTVLSISEIMPCIIWDLIFALRNCFCFS